MSLEPLPSRYGARSGRVRFGAVVGEVGREAAALGVCHALLVTDAGVKRAGLTAPVLQALKRASVRVTLWTEVQPNPTESAVNAASVKAREAGVDGIIALGGGSVLDTAKGAAMLLAHGGRMADHHGPGSDGAVLLPLLMIPTTAGTGSESQSFALISRDGDHVKMACGDPHGIPAVSLLDPSLTVSCPPRVTALAGMDALVHAVETFVTTVGTEASRARALKAFELLWAGLPQAMAAPGDLEARGRVLKGSTMAGQAIEASMLGGAHASANPLTARYHLPHGEMVGLMLPHVVRHNACEAYSTLEARVGGDLAGALTALQANIGLRTRLSACGVEREAIPALAEDASTQWTGRFNPVPLDAAVFAELYRAAW